MTRIEVEAAINEAIRTLCALPDRTPVYARVTWWPETLREAADVWANAVAQGGYERMRPGPSRPSGDAIDRMLPVLDWLRNLDDRARAVIWARAFGVPWWKLASRFGRSEDTVQRWHRSAIDLVLSWLKIGRLSWPAAVSAA